MPVIESFQTARLRAEQLHAKHLAELYRMHQDPRVMRTLAPAGHPNQGMLSEEETRQFLRRKLEHWARYGYGLWMFYDAATGQFVGRAGLQHVQIDGSDEVELAYALVAEAWGQGLATELAQALVRIGCEQLGLQNIVCFTLTTNYASQRVMEKAGFRYERDFVHAGLPHVLCRIGGENKEQRTTEPRTKCPLGEPRTKN